MRKLFLLLLVTFSCVAQEAHPTLALGSPAPDFSLPGVDGKVHKLSDYANSKVLAVVFTCNHCPIAQLYEDRLDALAADFRDKNVAVVAIQPNSPSAIRIDELDSSDISDTLAEMKIRMAWRHLNYPYLYDGDTQAVAERYGPKATPHVFVFDQDRKLRYEGRMDNSYRKELVKTQDARNAIEALLAGRPVEVPHTGVFGCSTKWKSKEAARIETLKKIEAEPVSLNVATGADVQALRSNAGGKLILVSFWSTSCDLCIREMSDLQDVFRMYRDRDFDLVTVAVDKPAEREAVLKILKQYHASTRNLLFASQDAAALRSAFHSKWESGLPYVALISPEGKIAYEKTGGLDMLSLRRTILANVTAAYIGFQNYWKTPVDTRVLVSYSR